MVVSGSAAEVVRRHKRAEGQEALRTADLETRRYGSSATCERCGLVEAQHGEDALAQWGYFRTLEVDLAIDGHEQLDCLELGVVGGEGSPLMHKLVGQVLDGVAKNL